MPIDMTLAKAPPRKRAAASNTPTRVSNAPQQDTRTVSEKRVDGLLGIAQLVQGGLLMFGQWADAATMGTHSEPLAREAVKLADSSEAWAKPIDFLIELGPYAGLISAGLPFVMQLMANHKMLNAGMLINQGVVPPELLEAQMKAQVARQVSEAMKAQKMAAEQAKEAQLEYERLMSEAA